MITRGGTAPSSRTRTRLDLCPQDRIDVQVMPTVGPCLRGPEYALAYEAGLFERSLFCDVLDVRGGLNSLDVCRGERVLGQLALSSRADASTASVRSQRDADVESSRTTVRSIADYVPGHVSDDRIRPVVLTHLDDEAFDGHLADAFIESPVVPWGSGFGHLVGIEPWPHS